MAKPKSVLVRVPATTANLGPGFDCLGLALDIWNEIEFSILGDSLHIKIEGEGSHTLPRDSANLIFQCMQILASIAMRSLPEGILIKCKNNIPVSSGLGSSSSAIICGLLGAKALLDLNISDHELLKTALSFEEHADNISACLYGGLTITAFSAGELVVKKLAIKPLRAVIALPNVNLSTSQARAVLSDSVTMKDAIFNIGRTALLINSLQEGNYEYLKLAMQDSIHQPYRLSLIPGAEAAIFSALEAKALGAALSGAGPSVIAFVEKEDQNMAELMLQSFKNANMPARLLTTTSTNQGAQVINKE